MGRIPARVAESPALSPGGEFRISGFSSGRGVRSRWMECCLGTRVLSFLLRDTVWLGLHSSRSHHCSEEDVPLVLAFLCTLALSWFRFVTHTRPSVCDRQHGSSVTPDDMPRLLELTEASLLSELWGRVGSLCRGPGVHAVGDPHAVTLSCP